MAGAAVALAAAARAEVGEMSDRSTRPGAFLTREEATAVEKAIGEAEKVTSGEIRVMISRTVSGDVLAEAAKRFHRLGMDKTALGNGVLILLAVKSHTFAIYGGAGIHKHMGDEGWGRVRDGMAERFKAGDFGGGLVYGVKTVGDTLAEKFPCCADDVNELSNEVVEE